MEKIDQSKFKRLSDDDRTPELIVRSVVTCWSDAWRRFRENKVALVAFTISVFLAVMVTIGPMLAGYSHEQLAGEASLLPSRKFWSGTDELGRDVFIRIWRGGRISIIIGLAGAIIGTVIGSIYGAASAFLGGKVDTIVMRTVEILISIPYLLSVITLRLALNSNDVGTLVLATTITGWYGLTRLVRGQILSLKEQDYIMTTRVSGVSNKDIIIKRLTPSILSVILVSVSFNVPGYIFSEAFLSYLGLGIQPPETSWGLMCSQAQQVFQFYPYRLFFPALMIGLIMLSFTLLGDGLRDVLDPNLRQ